MKTPRKTILSASAISAFALTLALGLSANVDQTSRQQGAPLQGVHPPTQYGTPGEREVGWQDPGVTEDGLTERAAERESSAQRSVQEREQVREFGQRRETRTHSTTHRASGKQANMASELMDKRVENAQGERLGSVEDIVIDVESGELEYVVISSGGVMGVGDELRAVPPEALQTSGNDRVVLDITRDRWEQAPTFEKQRIQELGQSQRADEIRSFYRTDTASLRSEAASSAGQTEFGAREPSESSATTEWGSRSSSQAEIEAESSASPRAGVAPASPSQSWQRRHQTAEPHRLPGDPAGTPAEPRVMHRSQLDDQASLNIDRQESLQTEIQSDQIEFGARQAEPYEYDSRATEWRARAFEEDLRQAGADEDAAQQRQTEFGSRQMREAQVNEGPTLRNPRLHYTNRGSERGATPTPLFSAVEQHRSEQQAVYGAPARSERSESRMKMDSTKSASTSAHASSNLKLGSELLGSEVTDQQQENVGKISDFLVNLEEGEVQHTILETEAKPQKFAVPLGQLQIEEQGRVTLQASRQQLEQAPAYQSASAGGDRIFRYEEQRTEQTREFGARPADESRSDLTPKAAKEADAQASQSSTSVESSSATIQSDSSASSAASESPSARSTEESATATEFGAAEREADELEREADQLESDLATEAEDAAEDMEDAADSAADETRETASEARREIEDAAAETGNP